MVNVVTGACTVDPTPDSRQGRNFPSIICAATVPATLGGICTTDIGGPLLTAAGLIGIASWHPTPCGDQPVILNYFKLNFDLFIECFLLGRMNT